MNEYYVYVLFRETGVPFYVGMGKGDRWLSHEKRSSIIKISEKNSIIRRVLSILGEVPKVKVAENLTRDQASKIEIALIRLLGRKPEGFLVNRTSGGEIGFEHNEETRKRLSDFRKEYSATLKGKKSISDGQKRRYENPLEREASRIRGLEISSRPGMLELYREAQTRPYVVEKRLETHKGKKRSDESKQKMSLAQTNRFSDPKERERISVLQRNGWTKEAREKLGDVRRDQAIINPCIWINNGIQETKHPKYQNIPSGWVRGRLKRR
jgi:hypothetical protein